MYTKVSRFFLISLIAFLFGVIKVTAQDHLAKPLSVFLEDYKERESLIFKEIDDNNKNLSFDQKLIVYNNELSKLKEDFKKKRKLEYQLKSVKRARKSACKGTHIRRVTDCESVLVKAPNKYMYTTEKWAQVNKEGQNNSIKVFVDSSFVSLKISSTGMKVNKASVYTIFKYKPNVIDAIVEKETTELFQEITNK